MGGILGGSSKTDRGAQLGARQGLWNVFNYALPQGQAQQAQGQGNLNQVAAYWQKLLQPGRTAATQMAAPAVNTALDQADAARRQAGAIGTGRTGGTAAIQSNAGATTQKTIDDIVNQNLQTGRAEAATGLTNIGDTELDNSLKMMGLGEDAVNKIMDDALKSRSIDPQGGIGKMIGGLLGSFFGPIGTAAGTAIGGDLFGGGGGGGGVQAASPFDTAAAASGAADTGLADYAALGF